MKNRVNLPYLEKFESSGDRSKNLLDLFFFFLILVYTP